MSLAKDIDAAIQGVKRRKDVEKETVRLTDTLREELVEAIAPAMRKMADEVVESVKGIEIEIPPVKVPDVKVPEANITVEAPAPVVVPTPKVIVSPLSPTPPVVVPAPKVTVEAPPPIVVPAPKVEYKPPDINFPSVMEVADIGLRDVDARNPLPVQMMGTDGKPLMNLAGGGGGGGSRKGAVAGIFNEKNQSMMDGDSLQVSLTADNAGLATETTLEAVRGNLAPYTTLIDDFTVVNKTYIGKAVAGSSEGGTVWQIKCLDETGNFLKTQFADGVSTYTKEWDNRVGYAYS